MSSTPDITVIHQIAQCSCCGSALLEASGDYDARQVFDLAPMEIQVTGHQAMKKTCRACGKQNRTRFPKDLSQGVQYGNNLKSLCVYLQNYQMLPYARCRELITDLTGHSVSTGSLSNF